MILKYYLNEKKEKIYTLDKTHQNKQTLEAHYKFIKFIEDPNKVVQ